MDHQPRPHSIDMVLVGFRRIIIRSQKKGKRGIAQYASAKLHLAAMRRIEVT